jgi:predicted dehydrogenase
MSPLPEPGPTAAIVGTGFIGPVHLEALRRLAIPVRGILGSTPEKSIAAARAHGLEVGYATFAELLADPAVSVVHLTSPNRHHHRQVLEALAAGKHVICEKPLGMTPAETAELVAAAAAHPHLVCAVNYNIRFYPSALHARSMIQRGELGEVFHLHGSYEQDWLMLPTDFNWRVLAEEGGELRAVGDVGTHLLDLAQFVTGLEIEEVCADLQTVHPVRQRPPHGSVETFSGRSDGPAPATEPVAITTDDTASILLRFKGGARGCVTVSQVTAGRKNCVRLELAGSRKAIAWNSERPDELWIGQRGAPNQLMMRDPSMMTPDVAPYSNYPAGHAEGFPDGFKQLYRAIYADIRAGRQSPQPLYATFADGHRELLLCAAIARSHRTRSWVRVGD